MISRFPDGLPEHLAGAAVISHPLSGGGGVSRAEGVPLPAQRVSLQRHGRAVFSARTDDDGQIALPALERGVYEVSCPGVSAAFRLDLRSTP